MEKAVSLAKSAVAGKIPFPEDVRSRVEFGDEVVTVTIPSDWDGHSLGADFIFKVEINRKTLEKRIILAP